MQNNSNVSSHCFSKLIFITIAEGLIKHLQEVATKSQEEISNIKQKSNETELSDCTLNLPLFAINLPSPDETIKYVNKHLYNS